MASSSATTEEGVEQVADLQPDDLGALAGAAPARPLADRRCRASRTGVLETPNFSASARSSSLVPGEAGR